MRLCVISSKECWKDGQDSWWSTGGFPAQMNAIGSLFDEVTLIVVGRERGAGGGALPAQARVVPLRRRPGAGPRRKVELIRHLGYYVRTIADGIRQADAVHIPLPGDVPLLGLIVALTLRKRVLARYCGAWERTGQTTLMNAVTKRCMRFVAPGRHIMLATGEGETPPAPAMEWIFATALSGDELEGCAPRLDRVPESPPRLISVARLSREKGTAVLIDAIAQLRREEGTPVPSVTLVGDGPERGDLERRAAGLGVRDLFTFTGQLTRRELASQFAHADVCVQPSLTEGFSKAWLDAMAYGLPVLSSDVGAAPFVIGRSGERGWLIPPGDVPALASAIRRIVAGPIEWPQMRRRCRRYVEGRTLEVWAHVIGSACARRWGWRLEGGKLRP